MPEFNPIPAQQAIIDTISSESSVSVCVDARAGAAKTSTIVMAAQHIPASCTPLAVAFNKKIAEELASRLPSHFTCSTLNALGHRAWAERLGKRLTVDADKMHKLLKSIIPAEENIDSPDLFITALTLARAAKSAGLVPQGAPMAPKGLIPDEPRSWEDLAEAKGIFDLDDDAIYYARMLLIASIQAAWKAEIDFDDQIYMSVLFGGVYAKYHTVIVDEAQDLSALNHIQIRKLTAKRAIIVGDPYQAIYGFRGADSDSISNLIDELQTHGINTWKKLPLSKSFRVPHAISAMCIEHVPDFGSMEFLKEGSIEYWPRDKVNEEGTPADAWSLNAIPTSGAVLCRNNAPLMALAFAMIKQRRPVVILGRDIGASIANLLLKITHKEKSIPIADCWPKLLAWKEKELEKAGDSESKRELIFDRYDALHVLLDAGGQEDNLKSAEFIRNLFSDKESPEKTTFSSMHRAKGLEWDWVMILDPERIPSPQAFRAERLGDNRPMQQERNLEYVARTRSKNVLVHASLEDCREVGE